MKKLVVFLSLIVLAAACMPQLPPLPQSQDAEESQTQVQVLEQVVLPFATDGDEAWSSERYVGQPILIVFMGSWCPWCKRTMPAVNALSEKYAGRVEIVGAFLDQTPGPVRDAAKEHGFTAKALFNAGELAEEMEVSGLPHVTLFDKNHRIVKEWEGYRQDLEEQVSAEVDKLLK